MLERGTEILLENVHHEGIEVLRVVEAQVDWRH